MADRYLVEEYSRLDRFLVERYPAESRTRLSKAIAAGLVAVDGKIGKAGQVLKPGMSVEVEPIAPNPAHDLTPADILLDVPYEDDHFLVVNKPRGMASHPAQGTTRATLVHALLARKTPLSMEAGVFRPGIVHRLDKDTTGLMLVAKKDGIHRELQAMIQERTVRRVYLARVYGAVERERFTIEGPIGRDPRSPKQMAVIAEGKPATTQVLVLKRDSDSCLIACRLETGRTHQIRVHLASLGHPVKGDRVYALGEWGAGSMQLHSAHLGLRHPITGEDVRVEADPPHDFPFEVPNWRSEIERL